MTLLSQDFVIRAKLPAGKHEQYIRDNRLAAYVACAAMRAARCPRYTWSTGRTATNGPAARSAVPVPTMPTRRARRPSACCRLPAPARILQPSGQKQGTAKVRGFGRPLPDAAARQAQASHPQDYEGRIRRLLMPAFKGRFVADITTAMVANCHQKHAAKPTDANRAIAVLSSMMKLAIAEQMRPDNPCRSVERNAEKSRDRWLSEHELPRLIERLPPSIRRSESYCASLPSPAGASARRGCSPGAIVFSSDGCFAALEDTKAGSRTASWRPTRPR